MARKEKPKNIHFFIIVNKKKTLTLNNMTKVIQNKIFKITKKLFEKKKQTNT